jgi:hypothetical protein
MKPIMNVEFTAKTGGQEFKEESITFHTPTELFKFVSPGGGCERIADDVSEIQLVLLPHPADTQDSPMDKLPATLELGMIFLTGPLSDIVQVSQQLLGKSCRGELSRDFMKAAGLDV